MMFLYRKTASCFFQFLFIFQFNGQSLLTISVLDVALRGTFICLLKLRTGRRKEVYTVCLCLRACIQ